MGGVVYILPLLSGALARSLTKETPERLFTVQTPHHLGCMQAALAIETTRGLSGF